MKFLKSLWILMCYISGQTFVLVYIFSFPNLSMLSNYYWSKLLKIIVTNPYIISKYAFILNNTNYGNAHIILGNYTTWRCNLIISYSIDNKRKPNIQTDTKRQGMWKLVVEQNNILLLMRLNAFIYNIHFRGEPLWWPQTYQHYTLIDDLEHFTNNVFREL